MLLDAATRAALGRVRDQPDLDPTTLDALSTVLSSRSPELEGLVPPDQEALIRRFGRPAWLVEDDRIRDEPCERWSTPLESYRDALERRLRAVGRITLDWGRGGRVCGTGWLVDEGVVVTNRHVVRLVARDTGERFELLEDLHGARRDARIDFCAERGRRREHAFPILDVLYVEPASSSIDLALLAIGSTSEDDLEAPRPIPLDVDLPARGADVAVVGYPSFESCWELAADLDRVFGGIYDVKRVLPGCILSASAKLVTHDATTLPGSSGSAVLRFDTGRALGLHFGGAPLRRNYAVPAAVVLDRVDRLRGQRRPSGCRSSTS